MEWLGKLSINITRIFLGLSKSLAETKFWNEPLKKKRITRLLRYELESRSPTPQNHLNCIHWTKLPYNEA